MNTEHMRQTLLFASTCTCQMLLFASLIFMMKFNKYLDGNMSFQFMYLSNPDMFQAVPY